MLCTSCGRKGNFAENCFRTLSFPYWWGDRPRSKPSLSHGRGASSSTLGRVSGRGSSEMAHAHLITKQPSPGASANDVFTDQGRVWIVGLSDTQWKTLVNLLNEQKDTPNVKLSGMFSSFTWIIDT